MQLVSAPLAPENQLCRKRLASARPGTASLFLTDLRSNFLRKLNLLFTTRGES